MRKWLAIVLLLALVLGVGICVNSRGPHGGAAARRGTAPAAPAVGTAAPAKSTPAAAKPAERPRAEPAPAAKEAPAAAGTRPVVVHVVGADGKPYSAAIVWEHGQGPRGDERTTDAAGALTLPLAPGRHTLVARGPGTASSSADVDVPAGEGAFDGPTIALRPGATIRGRVLDVNGKPLAWVRVRCWQTGEGALTGEVLRHGRRYIVGGDDVVTDEKGEFALKGLEAAPHDVYPDLLERPGYVAEPAKALGALPGGDPVVFHLLPFANVKGRVVDAQTQTPFPRFEIGWGEEVRDADGRFKRAVAPGDDGAVTMEIRARGRIPATLSFPGVKRGDVIDAGQIALERDPDTGTLVVEFTDPSGTPIRGVRIDGAGPDFRTWTETCDDPTGRVTAEGLRAGQHTWWAYGDGVSTASGTAAVAPGEERTVRVVLARAGSVRLRLLAPDGRPETYVEAQVLDGGRNPVPFRFVFARPQGTLMPITEWHGVGPLNLSEVDGHLGGLAPGRYTLVLSTKPAPREVPFEIPATGETALEIPAAR